MSAQEVEPFFEGLGAADRQALTDLRRRIALKLHAMDIEFVERMSYAMPGFQVLPEGKMVAGYNAYSRHLSIYPHSGGILKQMGSLIKGHGQTKSALHFTADDPLTDAVLHRLLELRIAEIRK